MEFIQAVCVCVCVCVCTSEMNKNSPISHSQLNLYSFPSLTNTTLHPSLLSSLFPSLPSLLPFGCFLSLLCLLPIHWPASPLPPSYISSLLIIFSEKSLPHLLPTPPKKAFFLLPFPVHHTANKQGRMKTTNSFVRTH